MSLPGYARRAAIRGATVGAHKWEFDRTYWLAWRTGWVWLAVVDDFGNLIEVTR